MTDEQTPTSPQIEELRRAVEAGNKDALADFWRDIEQARTPLVELVTGDDTHYLVTFLYRDASEERRNVVVCSHALGWSFHRNQMAHLLGTDVWYRTYRLPAGARTSYWLSPDDSLVYLIDMEDRAERMATWRPDPLAKHTFFFPKDEEIPGDEDYVCSMLEMPGAPTLEWSAQRQMSPLDRWRRSTSIASF